MHGLEFITENAYLALNVSDVRQLLLAITFLATNSLANGCLLDLFASRFLLWLINHLKNCVSTPKTRANLIATGCCGIVCISTYNPLHLVLNQTPNQAYICKHDK